MRLLLTNCMISGKKKNILITGKKIFYIGDKLPESEKIVDIKGLPVIPGVIDPHVHMRDLELAYKEDWKSGSEAAIAGGVTTVFDMPNTVPPTTNSNGLEKKREAAIKSKVNYKFFLGAQNSNLNELKNILDSEPDDIAGIKIFLASSSSNEVVDSNNILKDIFSLAADFNKVVAVHTELQECLNRWGGKDIKPCADNHNLIRNRECAIQGTELVLKLANQVKNKLYIVHVSTAQELDLIRKYKNENIFCEVSPHHLLLDESIMEKAGNLGKVNPPLRTKADSTALWQGIYDNTVDTIGSDHAPHTVKEKLLTYSFAPSGFPGLETSLPLLLNEVNKNKLTLKRLIELTSGNAACIFGLTDRGYIREGGFADLTVINMNEHQTIEPSRFKSKAHYSPFKEQKIKGRVVMTIVNGVIHKLKE